MDIALWGCILFRAWTKMAPPKIGMVRMVSGAGGLGGGRRDDKGKSEKPFRYHDGFWDLCGLEFSGVLLIYPCGLQCALGGWAFSVTLGVVLILPLGWRGCAGSVLGFPAVEAAPLFDVFVGGSVVGVGGWAHWLGLLDLLGCNRVDEICGRVHVGWGLMGVGALVGFLVVVWVNVGWVGVNVGGGVAYSAHGSCRGAVGERAFGGFGSPHCVASPNRACLRGALGPSVIYSMPTGRPVGAPILAYCPLLAYSPLTQPTRSKLTNRAPVSDRGRKNWVRANAYCARAKVIWTFTMNGVGGQNW